MLAGDTTTSTEQQAPDQGVATARRPARVPAPAETPPPEHRERGRRQWRESGLRSVSYYHRDRPGRQGEPAVLEHPCEPAERPPLGA